MATDVYVYAESVAIRGATSSATYVPVEDILKVIDEMKAARKVIIDSMLAQGNSILTRANRLKENNNV